LTIAYQFIEKSNSFVDPIYKKQDEGKKSKHQKVLIEQISVKS
jgi:hypothetical protein